MACCKEFNLARCEADVRQCRLGPVFPDDPMMHSNDARGWFICRVAFNSCRVPNLRRLERCASNDLLLQTFWQRGERGLRHCELAQEKQRAIKRGAGHHLIACQATFVKPSTKRRCTEETQRKPPFGGDRGGNNLANDDIAIAPYQQDRRLLSF